MRLHHAALAAGIAALLSGTAAAQTMTFDDFIQRQEKGQVLASNLLETVIVDADGQEIGLVEDLLVDSDGQLIGVLVGVGGFLGIDEKLVAIGTEALHVATEADPEVVGEATGATEPHETPARASWVWWDTGRVERIVVEFSRDELEAAPAFNPFEQES
jgi:sporulation protein YlmC with PRC-barrel domain